MDNVVTGLIGFTSGMTLVFVLLLYSKVSHLHQQVYRIARHLNVDLLHPPGPAELSERVKELARDPSRKIEAIKVLREETGAGLADAKQAVEDYVRSLDH